MQSLLREKEIRQLFVTGERAGKNFLYFPIFLWRRNNSSSEIISGAFLYEGRKEKGKERRKEKQDTIDLRDMLKLGNDLGAKTRFLV